MLFLADQNLRHDAFRVLVQIGFEVVHTRWLGAERFDDLALLRLAEDEQMVLLTEDRGVAATWARDAADAWRGVIAVIDHGGLRSGAP